MKVARLAIALTLFLVARPGLADDPKRYEDIDAHSLKATDKDEASLPGLARYLAKPCKTDRDKARAIYRWITDRIAYDAEAASTGRIPAQSPAAVLKTRKAVCQGFADLFVDLSQRMGLKAVRIPGWAKIATHKSGDKVAVPQLYSARLRMAELPHDG